MVQRKGKKKPVTLIQQYWGLGQSDMANRCELLQRRELKQAKGAVMPGTKGERTGTGANVFPVVDVVPSAYGWSLSHFHGIYA